MKEQPSIEMGERERLIRLTSPDPPKAATCGKRHVSADLGASPSGRTKKIEREKKTQKIYELSTSGTREERTSLMEIMFRA